MQQTSGVLDECIEFRPSSSSKHLNTTHQYLFVELEQIIMTVSISIIFKESANLKKKNLHSAFSQTTVEPFYFFVLLFIGSSVYYGMA